MRSRSRLRIHPAGLLSALFALATAHPLPPQKVETNLDPSFDWTALRTFSFEQTERSLTDIFSEHPQAERWVQEALREGLTALGLEQADSAAPDFRIRISGQTELKQRKLEASRIYLNVIEQYIEARLTVEFIDPATQGVLWTGTASDSAHLRRKGVEITEKEARRKILKAVRKMLQRLKKSAP